jgi:hypothetical protein
MSRTVIWLLAIFWLAGIDTANAQQRKKMPLIGVFLPDTASAYKPYVETFLQGLNELGYIVGENVLVEYRYTDGRSDKLPAFAIELVRLTRYYCCGRRDSQCGQERKKSPFVRKGLARDYRDHFRLYILPKFQQTAVDEVTPALLDAFRSHLIHNKGLSIKSARNVIDATFRAMFRDARTVDYY